MRQPAWNQYEAALLIETYIRILNNPKSRESYISELSKKLRNRAINNGIQIDDVYRNVNGINLRLYEIQYLFSEGERGIAKTSRLFKNMVDLYKNDRQSFTSILNRAKGNDTKQVFNDNSETVKRHYLREDKERFYKWLSIDRKIEPGESARIVRALNRAEKYARENIAPTAKLLSATTDEIIKTIQALSFDNAFIKQAKDYNDWPIKALRLYLEYAIDANKPNSATFSNLEIEERKRSVSDSYSKYANNEESYLRWLRDDQHLAYNSCNHQLSALKAAQRYITQNNLSKGALFGSDKKEAAKLVRYLLDDIVFFRTIGNKKSQLRKYLAYLELPDRTQKIKDEHLLNTQKSETDNKNNTARPSEVLQQKVRCSETISVEEIITYARANKLSFSLLHFINSFNDTHLLIDGYTLASINYIGVNQEIARTVEKEILKEVNRTVPIADIGCIASFPAINVPWNAWLIYGLLKKWSNKIDVGVSSSHFKKAFPLLSPSGMMAESFSKFPTFPHSGKMGKVDDLDTIDDLIEDYLAEYLDNDNEDSTVL